MVGCSVESVCLSGACEELTLHARWCVPVEPVGKPVVSMQETQGVKSLESILNEYMELKERVRSANQTERERHRGGPVHSS